MKMMNVKKGYKLAEPFGIGLYIHWSFWVLVVYLGLNYFSRGGVGAMFDGLTMVAGVFGCVVLHELGHSLAARFFGIGTRDITLYPIGGVAALDKMPGKPLQEIIIALAGPAVNLVILIMLGALAGMGISGGILSALFYTNVFLVLFNLIPAFPMDGGRVFRAGLSLAIPRDRATNIAAGIGKVCAGLMVVAGLFSNIMLTLIGVFIWMAAGAEQRYVQSEEAYHQMFGEVFPDSPPPMPSTHRDGGSEVVEPEVLPPERVGGERAPFVHRG